MKTWLGGSALLSGLILGGLLASMRSCKDDYAIDAQGRLMATTTVLQPNGPSRVEQREVSWREHFPEFPSLGSQLRPGDRLVRTRTAAGPAIAEVRMTSVEVFRDDQSLLIARDGHIKFWGAIVAVSLFPLMCWGVAALWMGLGPPKK